MDLVVVTGTKSCETVLGSSISTKSVKMISDDEMKEMQAKQQAEALRLAKERDDALYETITLMAGASVSAIVQLRILLREMRR